MLMMVSYRIEEVNSALSKVQFTSVSGAKSICLSMCTSMERDSGDCSLHCSQCFSMANSTRVLSALIAPNLFAPHNNSAQLWLG